MMSELLVWKRKLQELYAKRTLMIDKAIQFILSLVTFFLINHKMGMFRLAASPLVSLGLAVVCTFLPPIAVVLGAGALILLHLFAVSIGAMMVCAVVFFVMFVFYCRFTPGKAMLILLTALTFWLKIPYVIPIACGLALTPISAVPVIFGTIVHVMLSYAEKASSVLADADGVAGEMTTFLNAVFLDKTLWATAFAFIICIFTVYVIRRRAIDHAWEIAIASGAGVTIVILVLANLIAGAKVSYVMLFVGSVVAVFVGMILEIFLFSVDYTRSEQVQFEDDEYYYYVKVIPKLSTTAPVTKEKKENEAERVEDEFEEIRRITPKKSDTRKRVKKQVAEKRTKNIAEEQ